MGTNILEQRMLDDTMDVFREGSKSPVSPAQGVMLIDGWLKALEGNTNIDQLSQTLLSLREALSGAQLDARHIRELLLDLATQSEDMAQGPNAEGQWTGKLESMAKIIRGFGEHL